MMNTGPGRVRCKLATLIVAEFVQSGMELYVSPDDLHPNTGYWRTDRRADVMPWTGWATLKIGNTWTWTALGSWATMSDLLHGFTWTRRGNQIELHAKHEKGKPEAATCESSLQSVRLKPS